jgi:hypothetical protein
VRVDCRGDVTKEETDDLLQQLGPGGPMHGLPMLALTQKMSSISADARHLLAGRGGQGGEKHWTAVVVTDPVIRVTTSFLSRINKTIKQRLFAAEPEAIHWLDERAREDAARRPEAT